VKKKVKENCGCAKTRSTRWKLNLCSKWLKLKPEVKEEDEEEHRRRDCSKNHRAYRETADTVPFHTFMNA